MNYSLFTNFILLTAKSLHACGLPSHRLESKMEKLCKRLNVQAEFFTAPGSIFASIQSETGTESHMLKISSSDLNLERMEEIEKVIEEVSLNRLEFSEAIDKINEINSRKERYSKWLMVSFFGLSTGSAASVFGGGFAEIVCSLLIGLGIGTLHIFISKFTRFVKIFVLLSALLAVCLTNIFASNFITFNKDIATICGLILLIPGFSFTVSITEMVNNHLIAGLSRFTTAFITFVLLAIGVGIGIKTTHFINLTDIKTLSWFTPSWILYIALIFVPLGFVVLFKAKPSDFIWISLACWSSYFSYRFSASFLPGPIAVFSASFFLGIVSTLFSRIRKRNSSVMLVPGMILLVPGSLGFFSISHLVNSDVVAGIQTALSMLTTSMALVFGLIVSNILLAEEG